MSPGTVGGNQPGGFTIIELLLATAIFSIILLAALAGFLRTGNLFYKGVSLTQTQATAKQVVDDVSANISNAGSVDPETVNGYTYYCIGNTRYTYNLFVPYISSNGNTYGSGSHGNFALLKDTVSGCPAPCVSGCSVPLSSNSSTEMLNDNMRLSQFSISPVSSGSKLYNVNVIVAFGDSGSLTGASSANPSCGGNTQTQQFCAVSRLSTSVYAGLSI